MARRAMHMLPFLVLFTVACGGAATMPVRVMGHRGSGTSTETNPEAENTIPSIAAAMANGADGVEIDVQASSDGVLVLMHDFEVDHTTNGTGCVSALTADALASLDAGGPSLLGQGFVVPTFREVLAALPAGVLDVELKVTSDHPTCAPTDRAAVVTLLLADLAGFPRERLVVSSFDVEILRMVRAQDPSIRLALIARTADGVAVAREEGFAAVALLFLAVDERVVKDAHASGLEVWTWTVGTSAFAEQVIRAGVDVVITDEVSMVNEVRACLAGDAPCVGGS